MADKPYVDIPDATLGIEKPCLFFPTKGKVFHAKSATQFTSRRLPIFYITVEEAELILKYLDEIQNFVSKHGTDFSNIPDHESESDRD